jgi:DNA-directed RNA polymerase specialized sigma24 family protein
MRPWTAHEILNRLPDELRDIATAHWIGGDSLEYIAVNRGVGIKNIRVRLTRARTLIERIVNDDPACNLN